MKSLIFSFLLSALVLSANASERDSISVADSLLYFDAEPTERVNIEETGMSKYDRRIHRHRKHWAQLIPTQMIVQYAGNMGMMSIGMGWDYGKHKQWETNLLFGYLPKADSDRGKLTMTLKQNFLPWSMYLKHGWMLEPLSCGLYLNTVFGSEFWGNQPSRYPDKYYEPLNTELRINVFLGQRITKIVPANRRKFLKSISAFYEVSTCDLYLRLAVMERKVSLWDILCLSVGLKMQIL